MKEKQNKCSAKYISYYDPPLVGLHMDYMILWEQDPESYI